MLRRSRPFLTAPWLTALWLATVVAAGCAKSGEGDGGGGSGPDWTGAGGGAGSNCIGAEGVPSDGDDLYVDGDQQAQVRIEALDGCLRSYELSTNAAIRDNAVDNPRTVEEQAGAPTVRSGHDMFDALYALALLEVREASVDNIEDGAFNDGLPVPCAEGGCFETGKLWRYVWTRDTAYSVLLGLAAVDPTRARNSLEFKTSALRAGSQAVGGRQIVQDTGTGGSYPISSDRVVWAMGAWELLKYLHGDERAAFVDLTYEAVVNTAEHDRVVVFDDVDGLYRGEQSFLDWREQSYPAFAAGDPIQIGMSKTLSTNVGHLQLLRVAALIATEKGEQQAAARYQGWADGLSNAIASRFYLPTDGMFSSFIPGHFDSAPVRRFDLLSASLAVMFDVGSDEQRASMVANYPHLQRGAPVIWPQQQDVRIYHNRAIWPFVSALWMRAAKRVGNAAAVSHAARSLMRGAALNLSNMENFEVVTGAAWLDDGAASGPVVNSPRQLWSVAGYLSMVHHVIFGIESELSGLRFAPFVPGELKQSLFGGTTSMRLDDFPYRDGKIDVVLHLFEYGSENAADGDALVAQRIEVDGADIGAVDTVVDAALLADGSVVEIWLTSQTSAGTITSLSESAVSDYQQLFGPHTPTITSLTLIGNRLSLDIDGGGESAADIRFDVYRDGNLVGVDLPGDTTNWSDDTSAEHATRSYCYTVESVFSATGTRSQHAKSVCWWGASFERIQTVTADTFTAVGGTLVNEYGKQHYQDWGDTGDSLVIDSFVASASGEHLVQLVAGNGSGDVSSGISCGVKLVEVQQGNTTIATGYLAMPQLGSWDQWRESSPLTVQLQAGQSYRFVVREDDRAFNMSELEHFTSYGGTGGKSGRFNRANIAEIKVLTRNAP
jgi:hypothetical protein